METQGRFTTNAFVLVAGILLALIRGLFASPAMQWLAFGLAGLTLLLVLGVFPMRGSCELGELVAKHVAGSGGRVDRRLRDSL